MWKDGRLLHEVGMRFVHRSVGWHAMLHDEFRTKNQHYIALLLPGLNVGSPSRMGVQTLLTPRITMMDLSDTNAGFELRLASLGWRRPDRRKLRKGIPHHVHSSQLFRGIGR